MPRIPIYTQQTSMSSPSPLRAQSVETPDYVGRGLSALGQGIGQAADYAFRGAMQRKDADEKLAKEAAQEAEKQKRAADAIKVAEAESQWSIAIAEKTASVTDHTTLPTVLADGMVEVNSKIIPTLENDEQRQAFTLSVERSRGAILANAIGKAQVAREAKTAQAGAAAIENNDRIIAMSPDIATLRANFTDRRDKSMQVADALPFDDAQRAAAASGAVERHAVTYTEQLIGLDPYTALKELNDASSIAGKYLDTQKLDSYRKMAKTAIQHTETEKAKSLDAYSKVVGKDVNELATARKQMVVIPNKQFDAVRKNAELIADPTERASAVGQVNALQLGQDVEQAMRGVPAPTLEQWQMKGMPMNAMPVLAPDEKTGKLGIRYVDASQFVTAMDNKDAYSVLTESVNRLVTWQRKEPVVYAQSMLPDQLKNDVRLVAEKAVTVQRSNGVQEKDLVVVTEPQATEIGKALLAPAPGQSRIASLNYFVGLIGEANAMPLLNQLGKSHPAIAGSGLSILVKEDPKSKFHNDTMEFLTRDIKSELLPADGDEDFAEVKKQVGNATRAFMQSIPKGPEGDKLKAEYAMFEARLLRNMYAAKEPVEAIVSRIAAYTSDRYDVSEDQKQAGTQLSVPVEFGVPADTVVNVGTDMFREMLGQDDLTGRPTIYSKGWARAINEHNLVIRRIGDDRFQYMVTDGVSEWAVSRLPADGQKKQEAMTFTIADVKAYIAKKVEESARIRATAPVTAVY